jgi:hypothetical protein
MAQAACRSSNDKLMPLEILHRALVLLRCRTGGECAEIPPPAGLRILLARIEPVFAGSKFADHGDLAAAVPRQSKFAERFGSLRRVQRFVIPGRRAAASPEPIFVDL